MKLALLLLCLAGVAEAQFDVLPIDPAGPVISNPATMGGGFFQFAPTSGAGMTAACACVNPTGVKGEAMTFTRAGSVYCTKTIGAFPQLIANGDMVSCGANLVRVMPGQDGSAVNGILLEDTTTNDLLQSQTLDNVAWTSTATVTANAATAPDNTATAEQLNDSSGAALQGSLQSITTSTLTKHAVSCYVMGNSISKASLSMTGTGNSAGDCTTTSTTLSTTKWTRMMCTSPSAYAAGLTAVTINIQVGTVVGDTGTIFVWGCQHESAANLIGPSSYVPTAGAGASRTAESVATFNHGITSLSIGSAAFTFVPEDSAAQGGAQIAGTTNHRWLYMNGSANIIAVFDGTNNPNASAGLTLGAAKRYWSSWSAGNGIVVRNATDSLQATSAFAGWGTDSAASLTSTAGGVFPNGVVKRVCLDPSETRCR